MSWAERKGEQSGVISRLSVFFAQKYICIMGMTTASGESEFVEALQAEADGEQMMLVVVSNAFAAKLESGYLSNVRIQHNP